MLRTSLLRWLPSPLRSESATFWVSAALGVLVAGEASAQTASPSPAVSMPVASIAALGLVAVVTALWLMFSWNRTLRAQVEARTRGIAEAAEEKSRLTRSLLEREQRMRMVVEQMPAILWSTDGDLTVTSVSGRGLVTLGLDPQNLLGAKVDRILENLNLAASPVLPSMRAALLGEAADLEIQIFGRDAELHIEPLRDAGEKIAGLVGLVLDVAERRGAAKALRDSEERYRAFVAHSTEGIWRWEFTAPWPMGASTEEQFEYFLDHAYVAECNDAMARLYGLSEARELIGSRFREVRAMRHVVSPPDRIKLFFANEFQPTEWETNWIDKDGRSRWAASTVVGIVKDGALVRAWSTQADITERKLAEEGVRHALSLVRATLDSATDGILVQDMKGGIVDVNERFAAMWRMEAALLSAGDRHLSVVTAHAMEQLMDPSDFNTRLEEILSQPEAESYDVLRLKDARVFERYSRPQRLGDSTVGRVWSFRDVTERERSMIDVQEANRLLEVKNAELERFTYTVSHDLKSPLITIRGYMGHLEAAAAAGDLEAFRGDAARINRAAAKMEDLLRDLLELSRVGRVLNPDEDVSMRDVAQDAADLLRGPLTERGVRLEISEDLPVVRGDRRRLVEVVQNLVENAIKFTGGQEKPQITVDARADRSGVVFFVRDNGSGIEERHREKVFELFEKLTPGTEGTGVGLALVKRIVEAHGGRVWVESPGLGQGSTFCFTLRPRS